MLNCGNWRQKRPTAADKMVNGAFYPDFTAARIKLWGVDL